MKLGVLCALLAVAPAPSMAQAYDQDRATPVQDDYGRLLRDATQGKEPIVGEPVEPSPVEDAKPIPSQRARGGSERREGEFLHKASEYRGESHPVRIVDRSSFDEAFVPTTVPNAIGLEQGSILIDTRARQLFFAMPDGQLRRYGIAVGREGAVWHGSAVVGRMAKWPTWFPTENIRRESRRKGRPLKARIAGGPGNPLGARAIYLHIGDRDSMYRIHGTTEPRSIGRYASHGCIRMINEDVIELYSMVRVGAPVIVR